MYKKQRAFSLVELAIVLVVLTIVLAMSVPSLSAFFNNTRLNSAGMQLRGDLNLARNEAIKRNMRVLVCARNLAGTDCAPSTDWTAGWVVCADANSDSVCDVDTPILVNVVRVRGAIAGQLTLTKDTSTPIQFYANGTATPATVTLAGTWPNAPAARQFVIAAPGYISYP